MSLVESQFKVSPSNGETSCIEKKTRGFDNSTMTTEVGKVLDQCLTKGNRAQTLGKLFAEASPAEVQVCVGNKLVDSLTFETIVEVGQKATLDPTDPQVLGFGSEIQSATADCGVVTDSSVAPTATDTSVDTSVSSVSSSTVAA